MKKSGLAFIAGFTTLSALDLIYGVSMTHADIAPPSGSYHKVDDHKTSEFAYVLDKEGQMSFGLTVTDTRGFSCNFSAASAQSTKNSVWVFEEQNIVEDTICTIQLSYDSNSKGFSVSDVGGHCTYGFCGQGVFIDTIAFSKSEYCGPASADIVEYLPENGLGTACLNNQ